MNFDHKEPTDQLAENVLDTTQKRIRVAGRESPGSGLSVPDGMKGEKREGGGSRRAP